MKKWPWNPDASLARRLAQAGVRLPRRAVQRHLLKTIVPWMRKEEIIVVTGARQTGKSVLLFQLITDHLAPKTNRVHYFNLDLPHHLDFLGDPDRLIELIRSSRTKTYVFIDEVQRLREPGLFLKGLYDLHLNAKFVVSGSSALEIKSRVHEALTGRKVVFHLTPFSMTELSAALFPHKSLPEILGDEQQFTRVLDHYVTYGGYPAVALSWSEDEKKTRLSEIFHSYLDKDVKGLLGVENPKAFQDLVRLLASQIGQLVNKDELAGSLGIHKHTLDQYLFYLEQTYVLDFVRPFYKNPRKELLKTPKVYFRDPGLRNFAVASFSATEFRIDRGALFENVVYLALKEKTGLFSPLHFWRTKAGAEVDFVALKGLHPIPIEVKSGRARNFKLSKSFRSFVQTYTPSRAYSINRCLSGQRPINGTPVHFLTLQQFLVENIFAATQ